MKTNTKTTAAKAEQSEKVNQKKLDKEVNELYLDQRRRAQARALWHMYRRGELQLQQHMPRLRAPRTNRGGGKFQPSHRRSQDIVCPSRTRTERIAEREPTADGRERAATACLGTARTGRRDAPRYHRRPGKAYLRTGGGGPHHARRANDRPRAVGRSLPTQLVATANQYLPRR